MRKNLYYFILWVFLLTLIVSCNASEEASKTIDPETLAAAEAVKLKVEQEGMYRVQLQNIGWEAESLDDIALTYKGKPIAYELHNTEDGPAIVFFGQIADSPYTSETVYILEHNPENIKLIATKQISPPKIHPVNTITKTIRLEKNLLYVPKAENGSPWQWSRIVAPQSQTIEIDLSQVAPGTGRLRLSLWGVTSAPITPDHHIRVSLNGQMVSEAAWDDQTWQLLEAEIPDGLLVEGINTLDIHATGEVEARIDIVNLDWVEIDYLQQADQIKNQEIFQVPDEAVQLSAAEGTLTLYEIGNPVEISRLEPPSPTLEQIIFAPNPNGSYLAVTENGYLSPAQILPFTDKPDLSTTTGASYLAIGHPELLAPLEPLLDARQEQGLSTMSIPVAAIYDQFNGGMPEPSAIQAFLSQAYETWDTPPKFILLVGDASYDFHGYLTPLEDNFLPTFLVPTVFGGETGSDVRMVQLDDGLSPDLAIGRVPARTPEQVEIFVNKTLKYEQTSPQANWNHSVLAIADGQEASFKRDANNFLEQFGADYQTQLIAPEAGAQNTNQEIVTELNDGKLVTAYFGHGSVNMWGKDSLFTTQDTAAMGNGEQLPVVWNFTCLTGLFTHPTEESLAESLLFNPNGGAVAVLAPTSPTLPGDQTFLSDALVEGLLDDSIVRLGEITLYAWQQVPTAGPGTTDVMQTFLLFGDPALLLPHP